MNIFFAKTRVIQAYDRGYINEELMDKFIEYLEWCEESLNKTNYLAKASADNSIEFKTSVNMNHDFRKVLDSYCKLATVMKKNYSQKTSGVYRGRIVRLCDITGCECPAITRFMKDLISLSYNSQDTEYVKDFLDYYSDILDAPSYDFYSLISYLAATDNEEEYNAVKTFVELVQNLANKQTTVPDSIIGVNF